MSDEYDEKAREVCVEWAERERRFYPALPGLIAAALRAAHARGRREGLGEAAGDLAALRDAAQRFCDAVADDNDVCRDNPIDNAQAIEDVWQAVESAISAASARIRALADTPPREAPKNACALCGDQDSAISRPPGGEWRCDDVERCAADSARIRRGPAEGSR